MIKRNKKLIAILLSFYTQYVSAQNIHNGIGEHDSHNPNSSKGAAGKDIINVDPYTGTGSVNIPIHDIDIDGLTSSVSLSYNAKGIRLDELSSSVGLGWDLSAGGSITREVNGIEDEVTLPAVFDNTNDHLEGYIVPGATVQSAWTTATDDDKERDLFHLNILGRSIDFAFTYHNSTLQYQTYPRSEIKIEIGYKDITSVNSSGQPIYGNFGSGVPNGSGATANQKIIFFTITDEHGNKFYFDRGDYRYKEYGVDAFKFSPSTRSGTYYPTEKWNLVKVETYQGKTINFEYHNKYLEYVETITETLYPRDEIQNTTFVDPLEIKRNFWKGYKSHLSKIIYPSNTTVTFNLDYSDPSGRCDCKGNYRLKEIKVEQNQGSAISNKLTYVLNQAYFQYPSFGLTGTEVSTTTSCVGFRNLIPVTSGNVDSLKDAHMSYGLRLKLKSISIKGSDNVSTDNFFTFNYNSTNLPYRFSPHKDFYGYYNGQSPTTYSRHSLTTANVIENFDLSIPYHQDNYEAYTSSGFTITQYWGLNRSHYHNYTQACVLNKIENACGGILEIEYKDYTLTNPNCSYGYIALNNEFGNEIGCNIDANLEGQNVNDGLVVGKVIFKDKFTVDNISKTEYNYSDGVRFNRGGYTWFLDNNNNTNSNTEKIFTNYFVSPHTYLRGSNHGFSQVEIITTGYNNIQTSRQKLWFTNLMYNTSNGLKSAMYKPTGLKFHIVRGSLDKWRLGQVYKSEEYDENGFLKTQTNFDIEKKDHWLSALANSRDLNGGLSDGYLAIDFSRYQINKVETKTYIKDRISGLVKESITSESYIYDDNINVKGISTVNSKGEVINSYNKYNYDYYNNGYSSVPALFAMNGDGVQYLLTKEVWKKNSSTDSVLLSFNLTAPRYSYPSLPRIQFHSIFGSSFKEPLSISQVFPSPGSPQFIPRGLVAYTGGPYTQPLGLRKIQEITKYDAKGYIIERKYNDQEKYSSNIWDTENSVLIATADNAKYDEIAFTSFEGDYEAFGTTDPDKGNFDFDPNFIEEVSSISPNIDPLTGYYVYNISGASRIVATKPLNHNTYVFSFWANWNIAMPQVYVQSGSTSTPITMTLSNSVGNWKLYTTKVTVNNGEKVVIEGNTPGVTGGTPTAYIDEVRLYPVGAKMNSYAFVPLFGHASINNESNYILYNQYDVFGHIIQQKDLRGNIIRKYENECDDLDISGGTRSRLEDAPPYYGPKISNIGYQEF